MQCRYAFPNIEGVSISMIQSILESGWVSIGMHVEKLEEWFRERYKVKHAIGCSSASVGLVIALKSAGWENKTIQVPAFTWPSTAFAVESVNSDIFWADINRETWLLETQDIVCDGILAVDTFGNKAMVEAEVPVIYDAAHGFDLSTLGHRGLAEVVSLSPTKIVTGLEGGMILTNDSDLAERAKDLRRLIGRMGEINAYVALQSIENYDRHRKGDRLAIVDKYKSDLAGVFFQRVPLETNYSVFSIMFPTEEMRDVVQKVLQSAEIETRIYFNPLMQGFMNTEVVYSRILSLPVYPKMVGRQNEIIDLINTTVESLK